MLFNALNAHHMLPQVTEDSYVQLVDTANVNRDDTTVEARSVEAAVAALTTADDTPEDRHPERCATDPIRSSKPRQCQPASHSAELLSCLWHH